MGKLVPRLAGAVLLALSTAACNAPVISQADYPYYQTVAALFDKADLVVEADVSRDLRVVRQAPLRPVGDDPVTNPQAGAPPGEEPEGVVITVRAARVVTAYKGAVKAGQNIEVGELGGTLHGTTYEVAGAVPLSGGARHVLFLETYPDAPASLLN